MKQDLTNGNVTKSLLRFAAPLIIGNILQQIYSITDTIIVGKWIGEDALAAVGSTYTLTTFLYSVLIGLCMGTGSLIAYYHGKKDTKSVSQVVAGSFVLIFLVTLVLGIGIFVFLPQILTILQTPDKIYTLALGYTKIILAGMFFIFLYNFYAYVLRALGNSYMPMYVLFSSTVINIVLDLYLVGGIHLGVEGAAYATLIAQIWAGLVVLIYSVWREPAARIHRSWKKQTRERYLEIIKMSFGSSIQQSVMNFGILMIQGLVNSFGSATMAAFTVAVKIDTLAYMPAQEYANAYSLFVSQNHGAGFTHRVTEGTRKSFLITTSFCVLVSAFVVIFSKGLMQCFLDKGATEVFTIGAEYLRIEGGFYFGIGILFLLYGFFRGIGRPGISLLLTIVSLGTRVAIAYTFSGNPVLGVRAIWAAIPIGWILADVIGVILMNRRGIRRKEEKFRNKMVGSSIL